jgi:hypothetical protein
MDQEKPYVNAKATKYQIPLFHRLKTLTERLRWYNKAGDMGKTEPGFLCENRLLDLQRMPGIIFERIAWR